MDRAEAIKELMPFTLCDVYSDNLRESCRMAIAALREQEQSKPLTVEELRKMYGEPVWVKVIDHDCLKDVADDFDGWGLVRTSWVRLWDAKRADLISVSWHFEEYGQWLAYRKPPKEGADHE